MHRHPPGTSCPRLTAAHTCEPSAPQRQPRANQALPRPYQLRLTDNLSPRTARLTALRAAALSRRHQLSSRRC